MGIEIRGSERRLVLAEQLVDVVRFDSPAVAIDALEAALERVRAAKAEYDRRLDP